MSKPPLPLRKDSSATVTQLQDGWGWKGPLETIWSNPRLKQGHLEPVAQVHVQVAF